MIGLVVMWRMHETVSSLETQTFSPSFTNSVV